MIAFFPNFLTIRFVSVVAVALFTSIAQGFVSYHSAERSKSAAAGYVPARITVDTEALFSAEVAKRSTKLSVQLPSGKRYNVSRSAILPGLDSETFVGFFDSHGEDHRIYITRSSDAISGVMYSPEGMIELGAIDGSQPGNATLVSKSQAGLAKAFYFGADSRVPPEAELAAMLQQASGIALISAEQIAAARERAKAGGQVTIDLLVVYTPGMLARHGNAAGVLSRLNTIVALMNDGLTQSQVNLTIRLVNATQVSYSDTGSNDSALTAISPGSTAPLKATIDGLRNQFSADLVTLIRPYDRASHIGCGLAWILGYGGGGIGSSDVNYAFSAVSDGSSVDNSGYYCDDLTMSHELGHNLGLSHDRANAGGVRGATDYGYGYINSPAGFGTIMSYATNRIVRFSNPNVICNGAPCGIARTDTANSADAAGAILTTMDAIAAFRTPSPISNVPGAPAMGGVMAGNGQVSVGFAAPTSDGGSPITSYAATCGTVTTTGARSPIIVTPLTNGVAVTCTVKATNAIGTSMASAASASVTPVAPASAPGAPTISGVTAGNAQVSVAFFAPASNGGSAITGYSATCGTASNSGANSPIIVSGLANGVAVTCTVRATNAVGAGVASAASNSVTPATTPGAPSISGVSAGNAQVSVAFSAPASNGGNAISNYSATCGASTNTGANSPIIVSGLPNGVAVTCTVKATNAVGAGAASAASASVTPVAPPGVPGAPTISGVTAGNAQVSVAFTAPSSNGGSAINGYSATCGAASNSAVSSPIVVSGLTNGVAVTCTVKATNAVGAGAASAASASVTPVAPPGVPGAPTISGVTAGNAQVSVAFTAPSSNGGSAINGYSATCGAASNSAVSSPIVVSGLTNGVAVTCTVKATNAVGAGAASAVSASVTPVAPPGVPGAPTISGATAGNAQVSVAFVAPVSNGGSIITGYRAACASTSANGTSSPIVVTGLTNGVAVTCTVTATNAVGAGAASAASSSVTPIAPGNEDSDSDGIPDNVELAEGQTIGVRDNAIFSGMHPKSDRWFAMQQYRDFLGREAEVAGRDGWTTILKSGAQSREQVIQSFFNSQEFQNGVPPVVRLYLGYFNRIPDHDGLFGWVKALREGAALGTVSGAFAASQEFQLTYGALSDSDFVTLVYRNVLGRAPDTAGFNGWLTQLRAGLTRGEMMTGFTESQEYQIKTQNNVFVIMMYEGMLRRSAEQAGYEGWVNYMNAGSSGLDLTRGFLNSLEYRYRFLPQ